MNPRVLTCRSCGSPVPLSHDTQVECRYCAALVPMPQEYREHAEALRDVERTRTETEATWVRLAHGSAPRVRGLAFTLTVCLPPLAALVVQRSAPLGSLALLGRVALPALSPGALLFGYCATADTLRRSFGEGLQSRYADGVHHCRQCGAPLRASRLSTTCLYCGADNLLVSAVQRVRRHAALATKTLAEALADLRTRQRVAMVACLGIATTLVALSVALDHLLSLA